MKRVLSVFLAALMVLSLAIPSVFAAPAVNTGKYPTGTVIPGGADDWYDIYNAYNADIYPINSADDLIAFAASTSDFAGKTVVLTKDIVMPANHNWVPKELFAGTFDGNGCAIIGLYSKTPSADVNAGGLIYKLTGVIKNLSILDAQIHVTSANARHAGVFAGEAANATIINCYTNATIVAERANVAGFVGHMYGALTIRNSQFDGFMDGRNSYHGGFVGNQESNPLYMSDCLNTGRIFSSGTAAAFSDAVYNGIFMAYRCVNLGLVTDRNGVLLAPIGGTIGSAIAANLASASPEEQYTGGGATRGAATYEDCFTLEGMADLTKMRLRSHSTINGIGPARTENHEAYRENGTMTDELEARLITTVGTITKKDYASVLEVLGNAWTLDINGELALSQRADVDSDSKSVFVSTYDELVAWAKNGSDDEGKIIVLTADIVANSGTASSWATSAPAKVWASKPAFAGTFDGNGHSISGLYGDALIEKLDGGIIKDLKIQNSYINSNANAGTFADVAKDSRIEGCSTNAILKGDANGNNLGGIVGTLDGILTVVATKFEGTVDTQGQYAAGIVANLNGHALIATDCVNAGAITGWKNAAGVTDGVGSGVLYATRCVNVGKITVIAANRASSANGAGIVNAVGTESAKGAVYLDTCYTDKSVSTYGNYSLLGGSEVFGTVNGATASEINSAVTSVLAPANSKWTTANGKPSFTAVASDSFTFISTKDELLAWKNNGSKDAGKIYVLKNDIVFNTGDASAWGTTAPASSWSNKDFNGTFDGNGFSISGLYGQPLVNILNGTVKNLSIVNSYINKGNTSGAIAARTKTANIINCYSNASVVGTGNNVGGFVGDMRADDNGQKSTLTFINCHFDGYVFIPNSYAGGFVANQQSNHVVAIDCLNTGNVYATSNLAGISDAMYGGTLTAIRCVNAGEIARIYGADATDGSYKKGDKSGILGNGIGSVCSAGSSATMFDCHTITVISSATYWDFRTSGTTYSYLNGQSSLSRSDYNKYLLTFSATQKTMIDDAMGSMFGYENGKLVIRELPTNEDVIRISNYEELVAWANNGSDDAGKTVILANDILGNTGNAEDWKSNAPAKVWPSKNVFAGTFEGGGNVISGLYGNNGLFRNLTGNAKVLNVQLKNSYFFGNACIAAIAGQLTGSNAAITIRNCYSNAIVEGVNHCGGILGYGGNASNTVTITGCWNDGPVTITHSGAVSDGSGRYASGIFGNQASCKAIITDCLNSGTITGYRNISGISNAVYNGTLTVANCVNSGKIAITCNPADFNNDTSTKAHAILAVLETNGTATVTNCFGMEGACVVNAFSKSSTTTGADVAFGKNQEYYLLDQLGLQNWGMQWYNRNQPTLAPKAFATNYKRATGFHFVDNGDGTATVTSFVGSADSVTVPEKFDGLQVTDIGAFAFQRVNVKEVILPEGLTTINTNAFRESAIVRVKLPSTLKTIDKEAFRASSLAAIELPESVTTVADGAFLDCASLTTVALPASVKSIGVDAFQGCSALVNADVSSVTEIADGAFKDCTALTTVSVSDALTKIGANAFDGCTSLALASLPESVNEVGAYAFANCVSMTDASVAETLSSLGDGAFRDCDKLSYVVLSKDLKAVSNELFYGCDSLTYVDVPETVTSIGAYAFAYCTKLERASIPAAVTNVGEAAFRGCSSLETVVIPEGVSTIGGYAFYSNDALTSVQLPASLKLVDQYAFYDCSSLTNVVYTGTDAQWAKVNIRTGNTALTGSDRENMEPIPEVTQPVVPGVSPEQAPQIAVIGGEAKRGETVNVELSMANNSGIAALKLAVKFDRNALTFEGAKNAALMGDASFVATTAEDGSVILTWIGGENVSANGTLASLSFLVADTAAAGDSAITVEVLDAVNASLQELPMKSASGAVTVILGVAGDVNDDGIVDLADYVRLARYLSDWEVEINDFGADCNGDGIIDLRDYVHLARYLSDAELTLGA